MPHRTKAAEAAKVAASSVSAERDPITATAIPPAAYPSTIALRNVVCTTARPTGYRSPSRMSGSSEDLAASNGGASDVTAASKATNASSGTPGTTMTATSTARARSQPTITSRRGHLSATPPSSTPPTTQGRNPAA